MMNKIVVIATPNDIRRDKQNAEVNKASLLDCHSGAHVSENWARHA